MPLESLSDEQINIHDLTLEQEKKPEIGWQEHFKLLKESDLYDTTRGQWVDSINEDQSIYLSKRNTSDQLLAAFVEYQVDQEEARDLYDHLKESSFFNKSAFSWNHDLRVDQSRHSGNFESSDQLSAILVETLFDKNKAKQQLDALKQTAHYSRTNRCWVRSLDVGGILPLDSVFESETQLLSVLIELQFDPEKAKLIFEGLKQVPSLYDDDKNQWKYLPKANSFSGNPDRHASAQLLSLLIESKINKNSAKEHYNQLKQTKLYDSDKKQWVESISPDQNVKGPSRKTSDQLLGVLCEHEFEESAPDLQTSTPSLPETRKY